MTFGKNSSLPSLFAARAKLEGEIAAARDALEATLAPKAKDLAEIVSSIAEIAKPLAMAVYQREEKVDGTIKFASGDAIFKSAITKTVSYDNEKLIAIANSIPWEIAQTVFKIKLDVSETVFKKLEDPVLKQRITDARTVKYSEPKITAE